MVRKRIFKTLFLLVLLALEVFYCFEFKGLIALTIALGVVFVWNEIISIRYLMFLVFSAILLIPAGWILHGHFYNWQKQAQLPILRKMAEQLDYSFSSATQDDISKTLMSLSNEGDKAYERYLISYKTEDSVLTNIPATLKANNFVTLNATSGSVTITYDKNVWEYWMWDWQWPMDWNGTYFRYWRAVFLGEVIWGDPPKYRDIFLLNIVILLLVIIVHLQLNFRRNFLQSQHLVERLNMLLETKE